MLAKHFTDEEILEAFNQMDPHKALGIDDLSGIFFKENWEVVGKVVLNLFHDVLDGNNDISCINDTIIVLIPKIKDPMDMTNFRPISLYKKVMKKLGFEKACVAKIMRCVRSMKYVVKWNTILSEVIASERGLRQGDPLSPYLFLINSWSKRLLSYGGVLLRVCNKKSVECCGHAKKKGAVGLCLHGKKFSSTRAWEGLALETYVSLTSLSLEDRLVMGTILIFAKTIEALKA
ncbi:reverse transcriptase [Gossypium australe]|uniref:Reverse transcriptase n=1 Tax=Gossypium australe TaxID=47621 RepID=A0A5B6WP43_9ROSI|nr:reverse transcriptase [Gossypium australe]